MKLQDFPDILVKECLISSFQKIGQGTYGKVYKAFHIPTQKWVALKLIKLTEDYLETGFDTLLLRELAILKICKHQNLIELLGIFKKVKYSTNIIESYVLMFSLAKCDLVKQMEENKMNLEKIKKIMYECCLAVNYIHKCGILHRDIKPSNILLDFNGTAKLADFGFAKPYHFPPKTMTNEVITLSYRPPEILMGEQKYTKSSDIWSLGCTFYRLAENKYMFFAESDIGLFFQIIKLKGFPKDQEWPEFKNLKYSKPCFPKFKPQQVSYKYLPPLGIDLINKMTCLLPSKRISACQALNHQFFNQPIFKQPEYLSQDQLKKWKIKVNQLNPQLK